MLKNQKDKACFPQMNAKKHECFVCAPAAHYTITKSFCFYLRVLAFIMRKICFLLLEKIRGDSSGTERKKQRFVPDHYVP